VAVPLVIGRPPDEAASSGEGDRSVFPDATPRSAGDSTGPATSLWWVLQGLVPWWPQDKL